MRINTRILCTRRKLPLYVITNTNHNFHHDKLTSRTPDDEITVMFVVKASKYRPEVEQAKSTDTSSPFKAVLLLKI